MIDGSSQGLPGPLVARLRREAGGDASLLARLEAEAAARRYLRSVGIPSWRHPSAPGPEGRYSLILPCGRRIAVTPAGERIWSFDSMAAARCSVLLVMEPGPGNASWAAAGWLRLGDVLASGSPDEPADLRRLALRPSGNLASDLPRPGRPGLSFILGSLRLLLFGEPAAPPP